MNHKDMPNVEELKAFAILQEALALGASYANRPDRGNGRTKIKRGFEAVATLKAALARRSLPSPEAGGAEPTFSELKAAYEADERGLRFEPWAKEWFEKRAALEGDHEVSAGCAAPEADDVEATRAELEEMGFGDLLSPEMDVAGGVIAEAREAAVLLRAADADLEAKGFKLAYGYGAECRDAVCGAEAVLDRFADLAERQASDLSTKDAENARLRGALERLRDYAAGLDVGSHHDPIWAETADILNPTKGAGA